MNLNLSMIFILLLHTDLLDGLHRKLPLLEHILIQQGFRYLLVLLVWVEEEVGVALALHLIKLPRRPLMNLPLVVPLMHLLLSIHLVLFPTTFALVSQASCRTLLPLLLLVGCMLPPDYFGQLFDFKVLINRILGLTKIV